VIGSKAPIPRNWGLNCRRSCPAVPPGTNEIVALPRPEQPPGRSAETTASLLIDRPVRSGQSIIFPEGDVSVLGSVGSGAEIVAGGSIHIYGTLRGRAMAGHMGNSPRPASSAKRSKPSCWRSTATTGRLRKSTLGSAAGRCRHGSMTM